MYRLVVTEKPSVGQSIAAALGVTGRKDGYMEGGGWLISWCVGHLAELSEPAAYDPDYAKWRQEDLPILPESWRFTIRADKRSQFDLLRTLLRREDVSEVVNACDAGREGELIFRTVYHLAGCTKPVKRLWISGVSKRRVKGSQRGKKGQQPLDDERDRGLSVIRNGCRPEQKQQEPPGDFPVFWESICFAVPA